MNAQPRKPKDPDAVAPKAEHIEAPTGSTGDPAPEDSTAESPDEQMKRKYREAMERKHGSASSAKQGHGSSGGAGHLATGGPAHRMFRRKAGG